jgi:hypothetical protein
MKKKEPDFFLSAKDETTADLANVRSCRSVRRLSDSIRDDYMLIEVEPPVIGQKYGLGAKDISHLIISTRHSGSSLFPINEWPCDVYIARILDDSVIEQSSFKKEQVELIGWGIIYQTHDEIAD